MGYADWPAFKADLDAERAAVHRVFQSVVVAPKAVEEESAVVWADDEAVVTRLKELGYQDPAGSARLLHSLSEGTAARDQGERSRRLIQTLVPRMADVATKYGTPDETLKRLTRVVETIAKRSAYLALAHGRRTPRPWSSWRGSLPRARVAGGDMVVRSPLLTG